MLARFPVICGPTASGKSALAVAVAQRLRAEEGCAPAIITADAFQVYRGMDIGTAKPTEGERRGVPHLLVDVAEPTERFTVDRWLGLAGEAIRARWPVGAREGDERKGPPIVVGGTHLYVKALLDGLFEGPGADPAVRAALGAMPAAERRAELERVDPVAAARIHPSDDRRTIRALEVFRLTGTPISAQQRQWRDGADEGGEESEPAPGGWGGPRGDAVLVCLHMETGALNGRINARVRGMMGAGLLDEVRRLHGAGRLGPQAREALGYKQIIAHLEDPRRVPLEEAVERIKIETRRFAKNQRTWLRRLGASPGSLRLDVGACTIEEAAGAVVEAMRRRVRARPVRMRLRGADPRPRGLTGDHRQEHGMSQTSAEGGAAATGASGGSSGPSAAAKWVGRALAAPVVLMLMFSGAMKLVKPPAVTEGFGHLGWPEALARPLGVVELACVVLYLVPATSVVGAILVTGYMGGAIAAHVRLEEPFVVQAGLGVVAWVSLLLREPRLRGLLPLRR